MSNCCCEVSLTKKLRHVKITSLGDRSKRERHASLLPKKRKEKKTEKKKKHKERKNNLKSETVTKINNNEKINKAKKKKHINNIKKSRKKAKQKTSQKFKKRKKKKEASKEGPPLLPRRFKIFFYQKNVTRNRAAIEAQKSDFEHPTKTKKKKENERK